MLIVQPADSERQPEPLAAARELPVRAVKTVVVPVAAQPKSVAEAPAPAKPVLPLKALAAAQPGKVVEPIQQRWAASMAATSGQTEEIDADSLTAGVVNEARFSALPMLPVVAVPMLEEPQTSPETGRKTRMASSANLRARPANGGKFLRTLSAGTSISLIGCRGGWCEVAAEGQRGFVAERFLKGKAGGPAKRKKASRKQQPKPSAAEKPQEAKGLPGVFPKASISVPSDR